MEGLKLDLKSNIAVVQREFKRLPQTAILPAARSALSKTGTTLVKESQMALRRRVKLKAGYVKKKIFRYRKHLGSKDIGDLAVILYIRSTKISLIHFVQGSKQPRSQQGISAGAARNYPRRRRVKIEVRPGRKTTLQHAFIAKPRGKGVAVFRKDPTTGRLKSQTVPVHHWFEKRRFVDPILNTIGPVLQKNFVAALKFKMLKAQGKIKSSAR